MKNNLPAAHRISAESSVRFTEEQLLNGSGLTAGSKEYLHGSICFPARFVALHDKDP